MDSFWSRAFAVLVTLLLAGAPQALAEERSWAPVFDFEQREMLEAWCTQAPEGTLSIAHERRNVREGRGALQLTWTPAPGRLAILSAGPLSLDFRPRSLRLSVKASEQSPIMYGVREESGASYQGYMYTPGGVWHDLEIDLDELMLSEGCEDPNDRLDISEIIRIIVADLSNLDGEAGRSLGVKTGEQRLWLDNVELSDRPAPHRSGRGPDDEIIIDSFDREPILCLPIGNPRLELVPAGDDEEGLALAVNYDRREYRWAGFVAAVGYLDLTGRSHICLRVKTDVAAPLIVVLEERDGSKYEMRRRLDPEEGWQTLRLPFSRFKLAPESHDDNEQLDLDQLRVIIPVLDTRRADLGDNDRGTWWIGRIWAE